MVSNFSGGGWSPILGGVVSNFSGGVGLQFFGGGVSNFSGGSPIFRGGSNFRGGGAPEYGQRSAGTHPTGMHSC